MRVFIHPTINLPEEAKPLEASLKLLLRTCQENQVSHRALIKCLLQVIRVIAFRYGEAGEIRQTIKDLEELLPKELKE